MKNRNWIRTSNRFVAFLDIMGFKNMVETKSHDEVYDILSTFQDVSEIIDDNVCFSEYLKVTIFSDSIVVFSKDDSLESFIQFLTCINFCLLNSIVRNTTPIKGAFAHGKITVDFDKSIFFGKPLIDSYLLQEDLHYYGAVGHISINQYVAKLNDLDSRKIVFLLFKGKSCFKNNELAFYLYANWFHLVRIYFNTSRFAEALDCLKRNVPDSVVKYVNNTIEMFLFSSKETFKTVDDTSTNIKNI